MKWLLRFWVLSLTLLVGCTSVPEYVQNLSAGDFYALMTSDSNAIVIDVRSPKEYRGGYIEQAINIPLETISEGCTKLDRNAPILLYCRSGRRSIEAAEILHSKGFSNLYNLDNGIIGWRSVKFGIITPTQ